MSDRPPTSSDAQDSEQTPGGWHAPAVTGGWRPAQTSTEVGWRVVPAMPEGLDAQPQNTGGWHLPDPEDTTFSPDDEIEIPPPEDTLTPGALPAGRAPASPAEPETPLAPEDLMFMIEHIDESPDDDFETLQMSELVALASLAENEAANVEQGAESPIAAALVPVALEDSGPTASVLSPAERAILKASDDATTVDPSEYARRQLAALGGETSAEAADVAGALAAGSEDPAEYARRQLAALGGEPPVTGGMTPTGEQTQQLNPRELELARRFADTQEQVRSLRRLMQSGQIGQDEFMTQLRNLMIRDDDLTWWVMGVESDTWYKSQGNDWVPAVPPLLAAYQKQQQPTGGLNLNAVVQDSLPYLTEPMAKSPTEYTEYTVPSGGLRVDSDFMPLPQQVPVQDPDYTVPNPAVYDATSINDPYAATVPSPAVSGPTIMAQPVGYGAIDSPYEAAEPPDYDTELEAPIFEEALERRKQSALRVGILVAAVFIGLAFLAAAGFVIAALMWYNGIVGEWDDEIVALANYQPEFQTVSVLDNQGREIATLGRDGDDRRVVDLEEISPYLIHAVLSLENPRYYSDPGWDAFSTLRAFWQNFVAGGIESGASTITQQVARNFVLRSSEATAERKVNEIIVAGELTNRYSKNDILELYLNEIAFGNQTYGVEAAAQFYFGVSAAELNLPQSALLAGLIAAPATYEPVNNRELAFARMREVMQRMAAVGCLRFEHAPYAGTEFCVRPADITSDQVIVEQALVEAADYLPRRFGTRYPHFVQLVQAQLESFFGATEIYRRGFVVRTTLDTALQDFAQQALINQVQQLSTTGVNTGAIMVTDPRNGAILAMVGSPDFENEAIDGQVNNTLTWQQPGSAIKPIVYSAALRGVDRNGNGAIEPGEYLTPASILWDVPTTYATTPPYTPVNFDRRYHGPQSLRSSLQNSYNVPAVKTYEFIGPEAFVNTAQAMGLRFLPEAQFGLATALGASDVRLYDMMVAFGTIANDGVRTRLYLIESVTAADGSSIPIPGRENPEQALSPGVAYLMQHILADDQARADQFGVNSALVIPELRGSIGAKSGTSDGNRDLWTMGFTSNRVVGVWLGRHDNLEIRNTAGSLAASPLWNQVMRAALQGTSPQPFTPPTDGSVIQGQVCSTTGALADDACPTRRNEIYLTTQQPPTASQGLVVTLEIDSWTGLRANENCPSNQITATFANITDAFAVQWLNTDAAGQAFARQIGLSLPVQSAPTQFCDFNTIIPTANVSSPGGGQSVQGSVQITGQVSADNFNRYQLEVAPASSPQSFAIIGQPSGQQQPAPGSVLGVWDTTQFPNGDYVLRLAVFSNSGGYVYRLVQPVRVDNPAPTPVPTPIPTPQPVPATPLPFDPVGPTPTIDLGSP